MGKKILLMGSKTTQIMWPHHRTCLQAGANARKYGYFLFISILPSNLLSHWQFFFFSASRKPRAYPQIFCQLPIQLLFVQGSCEPDRGLDIEASCSAQSSGTCPDRAPREVEEQMPCPASQLLLHGSNPPAIWSLLPAMHTAQSGKWKLSAAFSNFFFTFLQTRMREERREYWPVCDIMLLVHI